MNVIAQLLDEHRRLRAAMTSLSDLVKLAESDEPRSRHVAMVELPRALSSFLGLLKGHEFLEETILRDALAEAGMQGEEASRIVHLHHGSIRVIIGAVSALFSLAGACSGSPCACHRVDVYALKFAMNQAFTTLGNHFSYEETHVFPIIEKELAVAAFGDSGQEAEPLAHTVH